MLNPKMISVSFNHSPNFRKIEFLEKRGFPYDDFKDPSRPLNVNQIMRKYSTTFVFTLFGTFFAGSVPK